jgi:hypothetical protein
MTRWLGGAWRWRGRGGWWAFAGTPVLCRSSACCGTIEMMLGVPTQTSNDAAAVPMTDMLR